MRLCRSAIFEEMTDAPRAHVMDELDLALLASLRAHPRIGDMELSRVAKVARATVQSRLRRLQDIGVITSWGPEVDAAAAGYPVQAFVTLEIAQGALEQVAADLASIPQVLEAYVTTGSADVLCKVATASHADLQTTLLRLNGSPAVVRSTSVVTLSVLVEPRILPLLQSAPPARRGRAPAYRRP
jgi:DNA-binding Lrp family transcriptional regulator